MERAGPGSHGVGRRALPRELRAAPVGKIRRRSPGAIRHVCSRTPFFVGKLGVQVSSLKTRVSFKAGTPFGLGWALQPSDRPIPGTVTTAFVVAIQRTIARPSSIPYTNWSTTECMALFSALDRNFTPITFSSTLDVENCANLIPAWSQNAALAHGYQQHPHRFCAGTVSTLQPPPSGLSWIH